MKALIVEDETIMLNNIKRLLSKLQVDGERFTTIDVAFDGKTANRRLSQSNYDLVTLDLIMPESGGISILEAFVETDASSRPVVIVITAYQQTYKDARTLVQMGAHDLITKPFDFDELERSIRNGIRARRQLLYYTAQGQRPQCNWSLSLSDIGAAYVRAKGQVNHADFYSSPWSRWDIQGMSHQAKIVAGLLNDTGPLHKHWRFDAKRIGSELHRRLFVDKINESFVAAGSSVLHKHDLRISFAGPRTLLRLPLEFLNDGTDYLVLKHPMSRFVTGLQFRGRTDLTGLLGELRANREKLRILLIASNTPPQINAVDQEVEFLREMLTEALQPDLFSVDVIPTEEATLEDVSSKLNGCPYHILHYAGHSHHDELIPDRSCLYFWEKPNGEGAVKPLTIQALKRKLGVMGNNLRLVYLSCCSSAESCDENTLLEDDFLGLADGLVTAGIPTVVGYRWPVTDGGAREMAMAFYQSLITHWEPDTALFHARSKVAGDGGSDCADWLSPVLISQE